ncbi:hypothetical protein B5S30_g5205 [[Candida] boidinii]|nr:hypothetical protein B5S30_g5205 [[Candida] boidinii]
MAIPALSEQDYTNFWMHSGAISHVCNNRNLFIDFSCSQNLVGVGSDHLSILGTGTICFVGPKCLVSLAQAVRLVFSMANLVNAMLHQSPKICFVSSIGPSSSSSSSCVSVTELPPTDQSVADISSSEAIVDEPSSGSEDSAPFPGSVQKLSAPGWFSAPSARTRSYSTPS